MQVVVVFEATDKVPLLGVTKKVGSKYPPTTAVPGDGILLMLIVASALPITNVLLSDPW